MKSLGKELIYGKPERLERLKKIKGHFIQPLFVDVPQSIPNDR